MEVGALRHMVYSAAWLFDQGKKISRESAMIKAYATEVGARVVDRAMQVHGKAGLRQGSPVERAFRDERIAAHLRGHQRNPAADHRPGDLPPDGVSRMSIPVCFVRPFPAWDRPRFDLRTGAVEVPPEAPVGMSAFGEGTWMLGPADRAALDAAVALGARWRGHALATARDRARPGRAAARAPPRPCSAKRSPAAPIARS